MSSGTYTLWSLWISTSIPEPSFHTEMLPASLSAVTLMRRAVASRTVWSRAFTMVSSKIFSRPGTNVTSRDTISSPSSTKRVSVVGSEDPMYVPGS